MLVIPNVRLERKIYIGNVQFSFSLPKGHRLYWMIFEDARSNSPIGNRASIWRWAMRIDHESKVQFIQNSDIKCQLNEIPCLTTTELLHFSFCFQNGCFRWFSNFRLEKQE